MDRSELARRIGARSGLGFEEAERLLEVVLDELAAAASSRRSLDLGDLGRFEPDPGAAGARFLPGATKSAFGGHRRE